VCVSGPPPPPSPSHRPRAAVTHRFSTRSAVCCVRPFVAVVVAVVTVVAVGFCRAVRSPRKINSIITRRAFFTRPYSSSTKLHGRIKFVFGHAKVPGDFSVSVRLVRRRDPHTHVRGFVRTRQCFAGRPGPRHSTDRITVSAGTPR